jgi:hypothetical protein
MGALKYDRRMTTRTAAVRMTPIQAAALVRIAREMGLTVSDVMRFAIDELIDDIPEPRLFSARIRTCLRVSDTSPARVPH